MVDSRPSDALALALRLDASIFAEEAVLKRASTVQVKESEGEQAEDQEDPWREFLENLDPNAFGKYKM